MNQDQLDRQNAWKGLLEYKLITHPEIHVLTMHELGEMAVACAHTTGRKRPLGEATILQWIRDISNPEDPAHLLLRMRSGLYRIDIPGRRVDPRGVAQNIKPGSIISLQTALDYKPGDTVISVFDASLPQSARNRHVVTDIGEFIFLPMKTWAFNAGMRLGADRSGSYPVATPERAICDWLYLAGTHGIETPPRSLLDRADLDDLGNLASIMNLSGKLDQWLQGAEESIVTAPEQSLPA